MAVDKWFDDNPYHIRSDWQLRQPAWETSSQTGYCRLNVDYKEVPIIESPSNFITEGINTIGKFWKRLGSLLPLINMVEFEQSVYVSAYQVRTERVYEMEHREIPVVSEEIARIPIEYSERWIVNEYPRIWKDIKTAPTTFFKKSPSDRVFIVDEEHLNSEIDYFRDLKLIEDMR